MSITKQKTGKFRVQIDKKGMPRTRKLFDCKAEAEAFEAAYLQKYAVSEVDKLNIDPRRLSDLVELWYKYRGINLSDGERRKSKLEQLAHALGNPVAQLLTPEMFVDYRYKCIKAGTNDKTLNNRHGYLCALYNTLKDLRVITYANPLADVHFIKIHERQLSYLSNAQIATLLEQIQASSQNESTFFVTQICLRTGARWGESEQLRFKQLHQGRITFEFTKSKKTRTVPIDPAFYKRLLAFAGAKNPDDRVFTNCIGSFRRAVARSGIELPDGQCSHILRHSFASHFIMNGGNILTLQKILGHADIVMTMRYAHLAPDHLNDALRLNPLGSGGL